MKQVTIIYRNCNNPNAINFIKNNLEEVFGEYIAFSNCYLCDVKPEEKLKADAFLALGEDIFQRVKESGYVDDFSKIIKMNRSPDRIALNKISEIPLIPMSSSSTTATKALSIRPILSMRRASGISI